MIFKRLYRIVLITMIAIFTQQIGYAATQPYEVSYKKNSNKLYELWSGYNKIKLKTEKEYDKNLNSITFKYKDTKKREKYLIENKSQWLHFCNKLHAIEVQDVKDNKWADDASFIKAACFMFAQIPYETFSKERTDSIEYFLQKFTNLKIEEWTKTNFKKVYDIFGQGVVGADNLTESVIIRNGFYNSIVAHYGMKKEYEKAEYWIDHMKKNGQPDELADIAKELLNKYKE
jgi:pentatricopeptide repeat protein